MIKDVANYASKGDKASWLRRMKRLEDTIKQLEPVEDKLLELINTRHKLTAQLDEIRADLVTNCIHPEEYLVDHNGYVVCKFCERKLRVVNRGEKEATNDKPETQG